MCRYVSVFVRCAYVCVCVYLLVLRQMIICICLVCLFSHICMNECVRLGLQRLALLTLPMKFY